MKLKAIKTIFIILFSAFIYDTLTAEEPIAMQTVPTGYSQMQVNPDNSGGHHRRWWKRHHRRCHRRHPWRW